MLKVGLTGGIGSGKTSVSDLFTKLGVPVIDTDIIAHELVNNDPAVLKEITDQFGRDILNINGDLNRKKLAQIVFNVKENKQQLEAILHPKIQAEASRQLEALSAKQNPSAYAIIAIPLLIEAKYNSLIDRTLIVMADENKRIERVQQRDNRSLSDIRSIIANQVSDEIRLSEADDIIKNNSIIKSLDEQVKQLHNKYLSLATAIK